MSVFAILNIPAKMQKEEVKNNLELINLQYNRLYKRGFYWVLSTIDEETVICVQNSIRVLLFDDMKPKYDLKKRDQIWKLLKDQIDKISYQKESKNLGIGKNKSNEISKHKSSINNSEALSWRKGSAEGSSFDFREKRYKNNNYYNNNYNNNNNYFKRSRFNSDNAISSNQYEYKEYKPQSNNNYNNNNNNSNNNNNRDIEIDVSDLKYPLIIKNKYSFKDIEKYYLQLTENNNLLNECPFEKDKKDIFGELISEKPKNLVSLDELIEASNKINKEKNESNEINSNIKIPKMNPLSNMGKAPFYGKKAPY